MKANFWRTGLASSLVLLAAGLLAGCETQESGSEESATESPALQGAATEGWIRVVRGVNGAYCDAAAIGSGNDPKVGVKDDLTNLSISCSENQTDTVKELRAFLPNAHICYSTLETLRKARREVTVVRDPKADNPFHCLLGTITPNQFVSRSRYE